MLSRIKKYFDNCILCAVNTEPYERDDLKHILRATVVAYIGAALAYIVYWISSSPIAAMTTMMFGVVGFCAVILHGFLSILIREIYEHMTLLDNVVDRAKVAIESKNDSSAK